MPHEQVSFATADGLTLRGWFIPSAKKADKTLILLHGYPADKGNILPALAFLHADFNLLLFDFRYLGESQGNYSTAGAKEVEDLLAAIRFLKRRGIKEVGVWGFSMGGAVGLMAIDKAPEIKAVVSESSYASLAEMALQLFRMPLLNYPMAYLIGFWANLFLGIDVRDVSPAEISATLPCPFSSLIRPPMRWSHFPKPRRCSKRWSTIHALNFGSTRSLPTARWVPITRAG